ncbi:hypothetical protein [Comamonas sp.]|uniref:hypothetical protein n=1 Tax=Comamonas sp. TaxID=34028 RepID=UPI002899E001|nr:hypothetical protein [Comamonas sp.]
MIEQTQLTDAQIDEIFNAMPGGVDGWLKSWGYRQFARAVAERNVGEVCSWYSGNYGGWHSSCGTAYVFESDGPIENGHKFCHCCGKRLKVTDTKDTNDNP